MDRTTQCGHGGSGNCFVVGVRDLEHSKTLGTHDVVFYVAKRMLSVDRWGKSGREEAVKEMLAFPISHPAVCAPVGGIIDEESPTLLFPWWNGGQISHWIERELELRDFFSDMTPSQRSTYDDEMFTKIFPTGASLPHTVHGLRLREALDRMTTINIANRIDHHGPREIGKNKL
ncbi:hypothetical protein R1sor_022417 [Riccia sorocarpa]|uniref:Uncharacterized protein n=1 Tax=Riccia sorocarpa TaxID=122646 RepID=A0ABD3GLA0_9MARC